MKLNQSELSLMEIIWENEPIKSGELVRLAGERYGWKKSTVYTLLKRAAEKSAAVNENSVVRSLVGHEEQLSEQSEKALKKGFNGSLSMFLTAFLSKERLTKEEAEELKRLIDSKTEGN